MNNSSLLPEIKDPSVTASTPDSVSDVLAAKTQVKPRGFKSAIPYISSAIAALTLFAAVNVYAYQTVGRMLSDVFPMQNRDACWWAANNYKAMAKKPDVLLVGSSLMCRVVNEGDATYLHRILNAVGHYRSFHLEKVLSSPGHTYTTASVAVGGMNASDVGTLIPAVIKSSGKPGAIVFGIGPRDLFDNSLESPADAPGFRLAEKMEPMGADVQLNARPSRESKFKFKLNGFFRSFVPLYKFQDEIATLARRNLKSFIDKLIPYSLDINDPGLFNQLQLTRLNLLPADAPNYCAVRPDNPDRPDHFDFRNNYFLSYNPFRPALYRRQVFFLERFLKFCHDQNIKTIVVKMPLRADNYTLMPPHFYDIYSQDVDRLAHLYGAYIIDAAKDTRYKDADFTDTVHMSGFGSGKLIENIGPKIKSYLER